MPVSAARTATAHQGVKWLKFSEGLHPDPPDLKEVAGGLSAELFWVIKNGINMTGMPSFAQAGVGRRYLGNCGVRQEIAERLRRRLQDLDRIG